MQKFMFHSDDVMELGDVYTGVFEWPSHGSTVAFNINQVAFVAFFSSRSLAVVAFPLLRWRALPHCHRRSQQRWQAVEASGTGQRVQRS